MKLRAMKERISICMRTVNIARSLCGFKPREDWDKGMTLITSGGLFQHECFTILEFVYLTQRFKLPPGYSSSTWIIPFLSLPTSAMMPRRNDPISNYTKWLVSLLKLAKTCALIHACVYPTHLMVICFGYLYASPFLPRQLQP